MTFAVDWALKSNHLSIYLLTNTTCDQMYRLRNNSKSCSQSGFHETMGHEHVQSLIEKLHWLPVKERITFTITNFEFSFFDGIYLSYQSYQAYLFFPINLHGICRPDMTFLVDRALVTDYLSIRTVPCPLRSGTDSEIQSPCKMEARWLWSLVVVRFSSALT